MAIMSGKRKHKHEEDVDLETKCRIDDLNDALLELILARLSPWKYLAKSKCVSKRWNSIISNPDFTRRLPPPSFAFTLFNLSKEDGGECLVTENPYFQKHIKLSLDFLPTSHPSHNIVASTNDLIVVYRHINSQKGEYYVANPLTKQYVVVPIPEAQLIGSFWCSYMVGIAGFVNGVSAENVSPHDYNCNNNHGFRIVQGIEKNFNLNVHIYSSETDKWKTYLFYYVNTPILKRAITLNNKIHWLCHSRIVVIDPFNIDNVSPRALNLPPGIGNNRTVLNVCQNRLRIAQFAEVTAPLFGERRSNRENRRIKIWEIEDYDDVDVYNGIYYSSAKVKLMIDLELKRSVLRLGRILSEIDWYDPNKDHQIICCHPNDPRVVYFTYEDRDDDILFCCNVVEKKCKRVGYCSYVLNVLRSSIYASSIVLMSSSNGSVF